MTDKAGDSDEPEERALRPLTEAAELRLKNTFFRFLKENVNFEGEHRMVEEKIYALASGLYEIFLLERGNY